MTTLPIPTEPRIIAHFRPQVWIDDYAFDIDGAYDFDATDLLLSWPLSRVLSVTDHSYESSAVWQEHPVSSERPHDGPFEVKVEVAIATYLTQLGVLACPHTTAIIALSANPAVSISDALSAAEALAVP